MAAAPYAIHWFRRDLRIAGNLALQSMWKRYSGRVLGLFVFDAAFLSRPDFSHNRFGFFLQTLKVLRQELKQAGSDLLVLNGRPLEAFPSLFERLKQNKVPLPQSVSCGRDYEPFAKTRDLAVRNLLLNQFGIQLEQTRDHLLLEPQEILKTPEGSPYRVYTPFAKKWFLKFVTPEIQKRLSAQQSGFDYLEDRMGGRSPAVLFDLSWRRLLTEQASRVCVDLPADALEAMIAENAHRLSVSLPPAGSMAAWRALKDFAPKLDSYGQQRDFPAQSGTSKLSIYLKNGSLTVLQILRFLGYDSQSFDLAESRTRFLKEIVWREFYYSILDQFPQVETEPFQPQWQNLFWENHEDFFEAWKAGQTGYPIVDAGMRELKTTGWMPNRVRMIVASFLTKDLHIDWRWGERYFMEQLLDGDLAANNGGWQWVASTGCDAQPYFRIFNPTTQSQKFDPTGEYIRRWVPELKALDDKSIHSPNETQRKLAGYPTQLVDHALEAKKTLGYFAQCSGNHKLIAGT